MENMYIYSKMIDLLKKGYSVKLMSKNLDLIQIRVYKGTKLVYTTEYYFEEKANDKELRDALHHIACYLATH